MMLMEHSCTCSGLSHGYAPLAAMVHKSTLVLHWSTCYPSVDWSVFMRGVFVFSFTNQSVSEDLT